MLLHKWSRETTYDNISCPGGPVMSNIYGPPWTTYAWAIYAVTEHKTDGRKLIWKEVNELFV